MKKYTITHDYNGERHRVLACAVCEEAADYKCKTCGKPICKKHTKLGISQGAYCKECWG